MKPNRFLLLLVSALVVLLLLGGGLIVRVGAEESSYRQAVLFAEVLSLVLENYVDPVEAERLLRGAYEGMLAGLDPNGAYLTPDEVAQWKAERPDDLVGPGISVLKAGRILQVVAVEPDSPAEEAGIEVGDQIRRIDERAARDLSLVQARRMLEGEPGTTVRLDLLHPRDGFRREDGLELARRSAAGRSYDLTVKRGIAVLRLREAGQTDLTELDRELDDIRSRGVDRMLVDLRNLAKGDPRDVAEMAALLSGDGTLQLRDPSGRLLDTVRAGTERQRWPGSVSVLVNGATAGGGEALAMLIRCGGKAVVFGESTYGLGAEARLYELENGAALLVSSALWETDSGETWNEDGLQPDEEVKGEGADYPEMTENQLSRVLDLIEQRSDEASREAA
jgi:carboxyl-terminal processing protease